MLLKIENPIVYTGEDYLHRPTQALTVHNEFIQILKEGGIFLLVICIGFVIDLLKRCFMKGFNSMLMIGYVSGFLAFLVVCLGGFPFHIACLAVIGIIYIAGIESQLNSI